MAWTVKNYNAYLKAAKAQGLTHKEAQATYRAQSKMQGRPLFARDIERHPKYFKRATETAGKEIRKAERAQKRAAKELFKERRELKKILERAEFPPPRGEMIYPEDMADVGYFFGGEETGEEAEY